MNRYYRFKQKKGASIRRGQIITTFGPGALVNLELGSFIGMGIDSWPRTGQPDTIYEERFQNRLKVKYFRQPPPAEVFPKGIPYRRFPRWLFCPKCRLLKTYQSWTVNDTRRYPTAPRCPSCIYKTLVPMSFLVACRKGHLDDFPWIWWVHRQKDKICSNNPVMEYRTSLAGAGLAGSRIKCMQCGANRSLEGAFSEGAFDFNCNGSKPWSKDNKHDECSERLVTVQRGGSNVYFPRIVSSITIPPYTNPLFEKIKNDNNWYILTTSDYDFDQPTRDGILKKIAENIGEPYEDVKNCVKNIGELSAGIEDQKEEDYRHDEYQAFHGNFNASENNKRDFDIAPGKGSFDYSKYGIKDIFLVKSLREVKALIGFTRLRPFEPDMEYASAEDNIMVSELIMLTDKEGRPGTWKPAIEVRGEGIFITLDNTRLEEWSKLTQIKQREAIINLNYQHSCNRRHAIFKPISAKYILLHTLSHLLIRQLSFESGYSGASLRERIYCNNSGTRNEMQGILIYTAAGDSDGTLGGLVRQAKPERFIAVLNSMIETSKWCANDPLCIESQGQGFESLNLAACYACALLPETSCEEFNRFLDRALITGTLEQQNIGFFNK